MNDCIDLAVEIWYNFTMDINKYTPSYGVNKKHLTKIADLTSEELFEFLYAIRTLKAKFLAHEDTRILKDVTVAMLFGDTSLRTRSAIEIGVRQLGGVCIDLPYSKRDMMAGENIKDVVNIIARYGVGALITRGISQKDLDEYCAVSSISVINSTNDDFVPIQAICDMFTIWEKRGELENLKIAYVGKGNNNCASLIMAAIKCGMRVSVSTPAKFPVKRRHLENAEQYGKINVYENPVDAVRDADIVYTDNYNYHMPVSNSEREILLPYRVDDGLMTFARHNALFMHPLPATRGAEVTEDIIDGKNSAVLDQGENKLHTVKGILALLVN